VVTDVSERKQERRRLREIEQGYESLFKKNPDAVFSLDLEGCFLSANPACERVSGYSIEEILGTSFPTFLVPEEREKTLDRFHRGLQGEPQNFETAITHKDGRRIELDVTAALIIVDAQVVGVYGIAKDITERKRLEEELRQRAEALRASEEAERRFSEQLMALSEVSSELSKAKTLDDLCRQAVELGQSRLGFDRLGIWFVDEDRTLARGSFGVDETGELRDERTSRVRVTPASVAGQVLLSKRPFALRAEGPVLDHRAEVVGQGAHATAGLWNGEEVIGFLSTDNYLRRQPITERQCQLLTLYASALGHLCSLKRAEEALVRADRAKDQFLAVLAHELRNPLAPIRNAVQILKQSGPPEPQLVRAAETIERQVNHQARLLDDLLNVARIARGKVSLHRIQLDLSRLVRDAAADHRQVLEEAGLTLALELPRVPVWVEGDPTRLAQVLGNLLQNAAKFTDPGGHVSVRLEVEEDGKDLTRGDNRYVVLTVRDNGIGMEPEMLSRVFETFTQADSSLDRSRGGLGLGLALVKGLVELHGGQVRVESQGPGCGFAVTFRLPQTTDRGAPPTAPAVATGENPRRRVLVVEDNHDAAETLRELLELAGHCVKVAEDGSVGLEMAREFLPEVVLCDLGLPGMDGYAVAAELRRDPVTAAARLIAISGYGQEEDRRRSREAGFELHLTKPVDPVELERLLADPSARSAG
jgi:PAS domain S-box-containing protein